MFEIPGQPIAKGRPRIGVVNGRGMAFTPQKTRSYEDRVRQAALLQWARPPLQDCHISLLVCFYLPVAQSWKKSKREGALTGRVHPIGKPDLDNLIKAVTDGLLGVTYQDDALITDVRAAKRYDANPRVLVSMGWSPQE